MNKKVSIVIPVYGVERYLEECLDSVLGQSYRNIEIILVDDKTPDNSGKIADEYAKSDERIRVIHKTKNEGLNMARATGFRASRGDFVTVIDSDDRVALDYVEKLVGAQEKTDADITMSGYLFYDAKLENLLSPQPIPQQPVLGEPTFYNQDQMIYYYLTQWTHWKHNNNTSTTCCKLFRRSVLENVPWDETDYNVGEDDFETLYTFAHAKRFAVINDQTYMYRANPDSISNSKRFKPKYQGKDISVFEMCGDFEKKALALFGDKYSNDIYYRVYTLYMHYIVLLLNKGSLVVEDIVAFDSLFPLEKIKKVFDHSVDHRAIELIADGGLLNYLLQWLWREYKDKQVVTSGAESNAAAQESEALYRQDAARSVRTIMGTVRRRIKSHL